MKKKILAIIAMMCLTVCCSAAVTEKADAHTHACVTTYATPAGNWTERCHVTPNTCTVSVSMYDLTKVCTCGYIEYSSQRNEYHTTQSHNH